MQPVWATMTTASHPQARSCTNTCICTWCACVHGHVGTKPQMVLPRPNGPNQVKTQCMPPPIHLHPQRLPARINQQDNNKSDSSAGRVAPLHNFLSKKPQQGTAHGATKTPKLKVRAIVVVPWNHGKMP